MRRIVAALVIAALASVLVGCGGGGGAVEPADAPPADTPVAPPAVPAEPEYVTDRSLNESDTPPAPFPSFATTETPAVLADKIAAGRAMLIFFYDPAQQVTGTLRPEVDAVMEEYRGLVDLVTFDVGGSADSDTTKSAVVYASELGVNSTPYVIVVDKGGFITWRWKGYVDRAYIKREVERASK
jgi:predicted small lipoprotein YifL